MMPASQPIRETYVNDGFFFPIDVINETQAQALRADLEAAEAEVADDPEKLMLLQS